jgi:hypothetical protein
MTVLTPNFLSYVKKNYYLSTKGFFKNLSNDMVFSLAEYCQNDTSINEPPAWITPMDFEKVHSMFKSKGIVGLIKTCFDNSIIETEINKDIEHQVVIMKKGLNALPASKAVIFFKGFGTELSLSVVKQIYASHGLAAWQKNYTDINFAEINRSAEGLNRILQQNNEEQINRINSLYSAIRSYTLEKEGLKSLHIPREMSRGLFNYYLQKIYDYGMLGLFDKYKSTYRNSKISAEHQAWIVIDKIQNPDNTESYYIDYLKYNGIVIKRSIINKIFNKWNVNSYKTAYKNNLERLKTDVDNFAPNKETDINVSSVNSLRYVDSNFISYLKGLKSNALSIDAPGLFVLWHYIERLGIYPILSSLDLTKKERGYSWTDIFLFTIARIFYGLPTYNAGCKIEEPSISFFAQMLKAPCLSHFLSVFQSIDEASVFKLQKWLVQRLKELKLSKGESIIFDFNQIDLDVQNGKLRGFGKGPSSKKKICWNAFRPHLAWDADTGTLLVAEYRKGSVRGTKTIKRFTEEFLTPVFKDIFTDVYLDSEYTGKDVWTYVLAKNGGMGAQLTACLKQNPMVKKLRNEFLLENKENENFWKYWDKKHVYSNATFKLEWQYYNKTTKQTETLELNCMVKKNIKTGKYRCFASSVLTSALEILKEYSSRWLIENGIKDLIYSYFFDKAPGCENPSAVNTHFFIVSVCKSLYRMMQEDIKKYITNPDGTIKTLKTIRNVLFRQGSAKLSIEENSSEGNMVINFQNQMSEKTTTMLRLFYDKIAEDTKSGLELLGGFNIKFNLRQPIGKECNNSGTSEILNSKKII